MKPILNRDAERHGLTRQHLRTRLWAHPTPGVSHLASDTERLNERCRAIALALPADAVFTHVTSAQLRGWALPTIPRPPVVACSNSDFPHHDRRGVYVRRCAIPSAHREMIDGVAVASAEWTILELAEHLSLIDLVAVIDSALHLGHTTVEALRRTMIRGRRGVRVLRQALDLCDARAESRWESILRLLYVLSGIAVEPQVTVTDSDGVFVARADLLIVGTRRISEYDGADHRDQLRHRADLRREKGLLRIGYERFGHTAIEIHQSAGSIIRDAEIALGLTYDPRRLRKWVGEYDRSSLTRDGMRGLLLRMHRFDRTTPRRRSGRR